MSAITGTSQAAPLPSLSETGPLPGLCAGPAAGSTPPRPPEKTPWWPLSRPDR